MYSKWEEWHYRTLSHKEAGNLKSRRVDEESAGTFQYLLFDNDDEKCNQFPNREDKEKIETKVFTEKRYQQSRLINSLQGK